MVYAYVHIVNYDYDYEKKKKRHYGGKILSHDRYDIFFDISLLYIMLRQCLEYAEFQRDSRVKSTSKIENKKKKKLITITKYIIIWYIGQYAVGLLRYTYVCVIYGEQQPVPTVRLHSAPTQSIVFLVSILLCFALLCLLAGFD